MARAKSKSTSSAKKGTNTLKSASAKRTPAGSRGSSVSSNTKKKVKKTPSKTPKLMTKLGRGNLVNYKGSEYFEGEDELEEAASVKSSESEVSEVEECDELRPDSNVEL